VFRIHTLPTCGKAGAGDAEEEPRWGAPADGISVVRRQARHHKAAPARRCPQVPAALDDRKRKALECFENTWGQKAHWTLCNIACGH